MLPYAVQHVTVQNDGTQVQQTTFDYPFFYTIFFFFFPFSQISAKTFLHAVPIQVSIQKQIYVGKRSLNGCLETSSIGT